MKSEESSKTKYALCLCFVDKETGLRENISETLENQLAGYNRKTAEKGPPGHVALDIFGKVRDFAQKECVKFFSRTDKKTMRARVHDWCRKNGISLIEEDRLQNPENHTWSPGLFATITDSGIGKIFEVREHTPVFERFEIGGLWSGFIRLKNLDPDNSDDEVYCGYSAPELIFRPDEAKLHNDLSKMVDMAVVGDIVWPVEHKAGPAICIVTERKTRTRKNELTEKSVLPWALLVNNELITKDNFTDSNLIKKFEKWKSWDWEKFCLKVMNSMPQDAWVIVTTLELKG